MTGDFYCQASEVTLGMWIVLRRSEENPDSWDRVMVAGLSEKQARAIANVLNEVE